MTADGTNTAGEAFQVNREFLRLLDGIAAGNVNRSRHSDRDQERNHGAGPWNNHLSGKVRRLETLGLAQLGDDSVWTLTPLGERKRAEARAYYASLRMVGPA